MELVKSYMESSPEPGRIRLVGEVRYDGAGLGLERYWYEVPETLGGALTASGNPWLACLLPLAAWLGEPLRIRRPVDPVLRQRALTVMEVWKCWYPRVSVVPIEAEVEESAPRTAPGRTAAFFSGGVDSFFTAVRHRGAPGEPQQLPIDDLLHVWGLDIFLDKRDAYLRMRDSLQGAAQELGKELVPVATNLRETRLETAPWQPLYHGAAIASIALALESRYRAALIASAWTYGDLRPCGSSPLTDPFFSTSQTEIFHDGAGFGKIDKLRLLTTSDVALRHLHVCIMSGTEENCGDCLKCFRTILTLTVLGAMDRCPTFKRESFSLERVAALYSKDEEDRSIVRQLRKFAADEGRVDIAEALDRSLKHSARVDRLTRVTGLLKTIPMVRRLAGRGLTRFLVSDSVG